MGVNPADLAGLTVEEKLEAQSQELARRRAEGLSDPGAMIDWSAVRHDLRKKP
jgi:hypothetical protein